MWVWDMGVKNKLYKHQIDFLKKNPDKSALVWSCGTGKSRTAIEWSNLANGVPLVICPKALKTNWIRESKKWGNITDVMTKEEFRIYVLELGEYLLSQDFYNRRHLDRAERLRKFDPQLADKFLAFIDAGNALVGHLRQRLSDG